MLKKHDAVGSSCSGQLDDAYCYGIAIMGVIIAVIVGGAVPFGGYDGIADNLKEDPSLPSHRKQVFGIGGHKEGWEHTPNDITCVLAEYFG